MKNWLPTILSILAGVVTAVTPQVQGVLAHHPTITAILAGVIGVILHWLPSPIKP